MRIKPKSAEQPIEPRDEDCRVKQIKTARNVPNLVMNHLQVPSCPTDAFESENYKSNDISPGNKQRNNSKDKQVNSFAFNEYPVLRVSNVRAARVSIKPFEMA